MKRRRQSASRPFFRIQIPGKCSCDEGSSGIRFICLKLVIGQGILRVVTREFKILQNSSFNLGEKH
jgi:hypothetical protein